MTFRDKAYSLATLLCSAVMVVVAALLSVDAPPDTALLILGSAVVSCIFSGGLAGAITSGWTLRGLFSRIALLPRGVSHGLMLSSWRWRGTSLVAFA